MSHVFRREDDRPVFFIAEATYASYFDPLIEAWRRSPRPAALLLTPKAALERVDEIRQAGAVVTVHSVLQSVFRLLLTLGPDMPSLTVQDGIIEYVHAAHGFNGMRRYRPLMTGHIAVFGQRSANLVVAMGTEPERVHVTGSPRFDHYAAISKTLPDAGYVLLTTANRPGFGRKRLVAFYRLFSQIVRRARCVQLPLRVRLSRGTRAGGLEHFSTVADELAPADMELLSSLEDSTRPLVHDLLGARAVITTPSTVSLEAMAMGRPVAHLRLDAECVLLNPPWSIHTLDDVDGTLEGLLNPHALKMTYQSMMLDENLANIGNSSEQVVALLDRIRR